MGILDETDKKVLRDLDPVADEILGKVLNPKIHPKGPDGFVLTWEVESNNPEKPAKFETPVKAYDVAVLIRKGVV